MKLKLALLALSTEARFTLCNMAVEAGARGALIAPDETAIGYVLAHCPDLAGDAEMKQRALEQWRLLASDPDARFDAEHHFDTTGLAPTVTWGTSPDQALPVTGAIPAPSSASDARALQYTGLRSGMPLEGLAIQHVFIGSCTNGRIEDLRAVVEVIGERKVAPGVRAMVVPGSGAIQAFAERWHAAHPWLTNVAAASRARIDRA